MSSAGTVVWTTEGIDERRLASSRARHKQQSEAFLDRIELLTWSVTQVNQLARLDAWFEALGAYIINYIRRWLLNPDVAYLFFWVLPTNGWPGVCCYTSAWQSNSFGIRVSLTRCIAMPRAIQGWGGPMAGPCSAFFFTPLAGPMAAIVQQTFVYSWVMVIYFYPAEVLVLLTPLDNTFQLPC